MRILCTTHPGAGHLHPLVPLARALAARGHEVAVATAASFAPTVEATGLRAMPAGVDWLQSDAEAVMPGFLHAEGPEQIRLFARLATQGMVDDLLRIGRDWSPDLILRDAYEFAGWVAAERLGIPSATYAVGMRLPGPILRMWTGDLLARLPVAHGLPEDRDLERMFRGLYLNFVPDSFEMQATDVIGAVLKSRSAEGVTNRAFARAIARTAVLPKTLPSSRRFQPPVFDRSGPEGRPSWLDGLDERPTVYATLGTVFNKMPRVLDTVVTALADEPLNLVVTVGRDGDDDRFGTVPSNVRIAHYIPQTEILSRCDAVVTHGGYNTLMSAYSHGLPVCCLPLAADQPINTRRAVRLGTGLSCANSSPPRSPFPVVDPATLTPGAVRDAVRRLLNEPTFRTAARRLQREMELLPGAAEAAEALERFGAPAPLGVGAR